MCVTHATQQTEKVAENVFTGIFMQ